jgi:DNA-binding IclR family transcriptional regulator
MPRTRGADAGPAPLGARAAARHPLGIASRGGAGRQARAAAGKALLAALPDDQVAALYALAERPGSTTSASWRVM